jgi:hypothetical protein
MTRRDCFVLIAASLLLGSFSAAQTAKATPSKTLPYSIQVARIDSKVDGVPAEFSAAIYENLLDQLGKSGKFLQIVRSGDKRAANMPNLLVLKTTVEKFQQGSETTRAVTTVGGATRVFVHMQAATADGKALVEKDMEGSVRLFGANLRATQNLAANMAKQLAVALVAEAAMKK